MKRIIFFAVFPALFLLNINICRAFYKVLPDSVLRLEAEVEGLLSDEMFINSDSASKGVIYVKLGDILSSRYCYSRALEYYNKAYTAYLSAGDVKNAFRSLAAKAESEFMLARYDNSINNYRQALSMAGSIKDTNGTIEILNCLSSVMLYSSGRIDGTEDVMEQGSAAIGIPQEQLAALCANAAALDRELGRDFADTPYLNGDENIKDSLNKAGEEFIAEFNSLKSKLARSTAMNRRMAEREIYIILFFGSLILFLLVAGIYIYRKSAAKQKDLLSCNSDANERLDNLSSILERKISSFRRFLDTSSGKRERPAEFLAAFKRYINIENGRLPDAFGDIIEIADLYYNGIITRLRLQYPSLNDEELYMCALIALDFPISSIKFIYNHASDDSMYNKRARLKKKLSLGADERPEKFIKELLCSPIVSC